MIRKGRIYLKIPYEHRDLARSILGRQWDKDTRCWTFPISQEDTLCAVFPSIADDIRNDIRKFRGSEKKKKPPAQVKSERPDIDKLVPDKYLDEYYNSLPKGLADYAYKPFKHQRDMVKNAIHLQASAFFCEMGTGKTKASIDTAGILDRNGLVNRVLIICPKTLVEVWGEEIEKNSDKSYTIIQGTKKQRVNSLTKQTFYAIINYEGFYATSEFNEWKDFDMVILDESTRIKSPKAKTTKVIIKTFSHVRYKLILTGTPITQAPIDIYCQFEFLNPDYLGFRSFYAFRNTYCIMGGYMNYQIVGYNNLSRLKKTISKYSIQIKKEDCIDLPPKIYEKRIIEMHPEMAKQYKEMRNEYMIEYKNEIVTASIALVKLLRMQEILSGQYLTNQKNNIKLQTVAEFIKELCGEHQIVIWCRFRPSIAMLCDLVKRMGWTYSCIFGDTKDRKGEIDKFQRGENRVFIGQIQTGGMGITITAGTHVIIYENTFSLQDRKQFEDRVHRPGQTKKVTYIDLIYKKTLDEKVLSAISKKQTVSNYLVECFNKGEY